MNTKLQNPDFEIGVSTQPANWQTATVQGVATFTWDNTTTHSGNRSVQITITGQGIARWVQAAPVEPDSEYTLTGWVKTLKVQPEDPKSKHGSAHIGAYGPGYASDHTSYLAAATNAIDGTRDWTFVSTSFITGHTTTVANIACTLGEADALYIRALGSGTLWCDDLTLTKIRALPRTEHTGRHIVLDLYTEDYLVLNQPNEYLSLLDEVYDQLHDLVGDTPYGDAPIIVRSDASMYYGAISGNPILIRPEKEQGRFDFVNRYGIDFGIPHELSHDFDLGFSDERSTRYIGSKPFIDAEEWSAVKWLYVSDIIGAKYPALQVYQSQTWNGQSTIVPLSQVGTWYSDAYTFPWIIPPRIDYQNMPSNTYTGLQYILRSRIGWEPFKRTFRAYQQFATDKAPIPTSDEGKVKLWADTLSAQASQDLLPCFQAWGFPVESPTVRQCEQLSFTSLLPATGQYGSAYTHSFTTDTFDPHFQVTQGSLPLGLTLTSSGILTGTPTQAGSFGPLTVTATSGPLSGTQSFNLIINGGLNYTVALPIVRKP